MMTRQSVLRRDSFQIFSILAQFKSSFIRNAPTRSKLRTAVQTATDTMLHTDCHSNFNYEICSVGDCDNVGGLGGWRDFPHPSRPALGPIQVCTHASQVTICSHNTDNVLYGLYVSTFNQVCNF